MAAELPIRKAAAKTLHILSALDLDGLWRHPGLRFEKLHGLTEPHSKTPLYSLRITQAARALVALREGPTLVLISLHTVHDEAYRRR